MKINLGLASPSGFEPAHYEYLYAIFVNIILIKKNKKSSS
jgi:hypothetical protein